MGNSVGSPQTEDAASTKGPVPPVRALKPDKTGSILQNLLSPRNKTRKQKMCDFAPELAEVTQDEVELFENVGWGATGVIKRGRWKGMDVAAKLLFPGTDVKRFKSELAHWCTLDHPCIVKVHAACPDPQQLMILMEYVHSGNLADYLRNCALERKSLESLYPMVFRVAMDVAKAINYLHKSNNYIFRDLKPANILLNSVDPSSEVVAKVCDFGDCRLIAESMTQKVGTISYMAPEVFATDKYDEKADIYSYGIVLWEMITRQEPYEEIGFIHEIAERVKDGYRPEMPEYVPGAIEDLITQCWATNPDDRPSFGTIMLRLKDIADIWEQLDMSQILASIDSATDLDNDTEAALKDWVDTTFTDIELLANLREAEDEMDISDDVSWEQSEGSERVSRRGSLTYKERRTSVTALPPPNGKAKVVAEARSSAPAVIVIDSTEKQKSKSRGRSKNHSGSGSSSGGSSHSSGSHSSGSGRRHRSGSDKSRKVSSSSSPSRRSGSSSSKSSSPAGKPRGSGSKLRKQILVEEEGGRPRRRSHDRPRKSRNPRTAVGSGRRQSGGAVVATDGDDEESSDTSYDESGDEDNAGLGGSGRRRPSLLHLVGGSSAPVKLTPASTVPNLPTATVASATGPATNGRTRKVEQLRSLSQAKQDLHQLLVDTQVPTGKSRSKDADLLIQVLKASLKRESERVKRLKKSNEFLKERFKEEHVERKKLDLRLARSHKLLQEEKTKAKQQPKKTTDVSEMRAFLKHSIRDSQSNLQTQRNESFVVDGQVGCAVDVEDMVWCELGFAAIQPQNSPYLYSTFGVWYHAKWKRLPVRLCVVIGGINVQYMLKFRKLCTSIQLVTNHTNMVSLVGVVTKAPNYCLVFEGISGYHAVGTYINNNPHISFMRKLEIAIDVARALEHCHDQNRPIGHISSDSVLVTENGSEAKVMHMCHLSFFSQRIDTTWMKYRWMAPECIYGRGRSSKASDVFEFGILLWFLLMEDVPYSDMDGEEIVERLSTGWRLPLPVNLPKKVKTLLSGCWKDEPKERPTMTRVYDLLSDMYDAGDMVFDPPYKRPRVGPRPSFAFSSSEDALGGEDSE